MFEPDMKFVNAQLKKTALGNENYISSKLYMLRLYGRNKSKEGKEAIENSIKEVLEYA